MQATFLGVGEACDPLLLNTSVLLRTGGEDPKSILLDCGFSAAHQYFLYVHDPEELDCLWISHFHGDHFFGVPLLLLRLWEMERRKPLGVLGPPGLKDVLERAMDLAYLRFRPKLQYDLDFREVEPSSDLDLFGCRWAFARSEHSQENLALRLSRGRASLYYSGDGGPSPACKNLAAGCRLIVHESYAIEHQVSGHGSVRASLDLAREAGAEHLALVHMQRDERRRFDQGFWTELKHPPDLAVSLPRPGDRIFQGSSMTVFEERSEHL